MSPRYVKPLLGISALTVSISTLLMLVLATGFWLAVVVAAVSYIASRNPIFWCKTLIMVATVLYLVAMQLIIVWDRRSKLRRIP